jgi:hypothetical protein
MGLDHNKPKFEYGIELSETHFNAFKAAWPDATIRSFGGKKYKDATFATNLSAGMHLTTAGDHIGTCLLKSTAVHGRTIFYGANRDPVISKIVWVSPFKTPGYSNPSFGLEDFPTPETIKTHVNAGFKNWKGL